MESGRFGESDIGAVCGQTERFSVGIHSIMFTDTERNMISLPVAKTTKPAG